MDSTDPRRLAWLRAQAQSLGTPSKPVSEARKAWLVQRAIEAGAKPSPQQQADLRREMTGLSILAGVVIVGVIVTLVTM
ncbi:hypothetical protein [Curtobacterium sp. MCSS17_016]|uniref:hypothetical protein n=1 Tax=Curtobacterium sp. MCSS17_016 TaxID=2175644 RepID=UPI000DA8DC21|nr:hypothetical protein [Curtobacterium sp. MCSS17_016]WIE81273.1 hypothetical protein DEJ19_018745 [Curtobacterium sp. MCSS17_016]